MWEISAEKDQTIREIEIGTAELKCKTSEIKNVLDGLNCRRGKSMLLKTGQ